jgi:hypothetical protein
MPKTILPKPNPIDTIGNRPLPTLARLRELFDFEPDIGLLWKIQRGRARRGDVAGGYHHSGNRRIGIDRSSYRLDQIVRLFQRGEFAGAEHTPVHGDSVDGGDNFRRTSIAACRIR